MTKRDELIAPGGVRAKVKPLEWNEYTDERGDPDRWDAETLAGTFYGIALLVDGFSIEYDYTAVAKGLDDLEAAKAAAQADYEQRILSALEAPAAGDGEPVAWTTFNQLIEMGRHPRVAHSMWGERNGNINFPLYTAEPADAAMREALDAALCVMKGLRDGLHHEPSVQGRKWVHLGSSLNDAIRKAELALTAPGATTKSDGGVEGHADLNNGRSSRASQVGRELEEAGFESGPSDPSSTRSGRWVCAARQRGITLDPQDCDWPVCGCDPLANKVLDTIAESGFVIVPKDGAPMTDDQIKHMVDRFLMWQLPENFNPDAGISYTRPNWPESWPGPVGTNLFDAVQATAMVRHMLDGLPLSTRSEVTALASLQGEDAVERVARIIIGPRLPVPDNCQFTLEELRSVRWSQSTKAEQQDALSAARAILATGLVPDEAAIRADERERCANVAAGFDGACNSSRNKPFVDAGVMREVYERDEAIAAAIRSGDVA